jgi:hypothetical protein
MRSYRNKPDSPSPELLAAYADDELGTKDRENVETWLAGHPEASAHIEALHEMGQLWQETQPDEPDDSAWEAVLSGIENGLKKTKAPAATRQETKRATNRISWASMLIRVASAAAAILLLMALDRMSPQEPSLSGPIEPWPLASSDDVDIISMHGRDTGLLVVGEPPLREPLALASAGDVFVESVHPDEDGMVPYVLLEEVNLGAPMIVAPLRAGAYRVDYRP